LTDARDAVTLVLVLTVVVRARCLEAIDASASTRLDDDDVARSEAGVRS
jgi:hypothetical protein